MRRAYSTLFLSLVGTLLAAVAAQAQTFSDPNLRFSVVTAPGLSQPTALEFLGPNDFFVAEKATGQVKRINGGVSSTILDLSVSNDSERGLLGMTLHPSFASNGFVYLYYSRSTGADGGAWAENRLSRFTWNGTALTAETPLLSFVNDPGQANGPNHDGGPILFGPDGMLYGITGDLNRNRAEQNNQATPAQSSLVGGIFRLTDAGAVPSSNPFFTNPTADFRKWYAYGVRNGFGMAFDPVNGNLWDTENGPTSYDEVNLVTAGFNSGWNKIMGPDSRDPQNAPADLVMLPGASYSDPELSFVTPIGITSLQFAAHTTLGPDYHNAVIIGDNNTQDLYLTRLNSARTGFNLTGGLADLVADTTTERNSLRIGTDFGVVTDIQAGPDGSLYVLSLSNNEIYKVEFNRTLPQALSAASLGNSRVVNFDTAAAPSVFADVSDGLLSPLDAVYDANGKLYVADVLSSKIVKFDGAGVGTVFADAADGAIVPSGLAFDSKNNLIVANYLTNTLVKVDPTGVGTPLADAGDGLSSPFGLATQGTDAYVANLGSSRILKVDANGLASVFADATDGLLAPIDVAFDSSGLLYVADALTSKVWRFTAGGVGTVFADAADGLATPSGLAFDSAGNLLVSDYLTNRILSFTPAGVGSLYADAADGISSPFGLAFRAGPSLAALRVPEPSSLGLALCGSLIAWLGRRRRRPGTAESGNSHGGNP